MILELKKKDGLAKQMLQTAKPSDLRPVYKAFPSHVWDRDCLCSLTLKALGLSWTSYMVRRL